MLLQLHPASFLECFISTSLSENDKNAIELNKTKVEMRIFFMFVVGLVGKNMVKNSIQWLRHRNIRRMVICLVFFFGSSMLHYCMLKGLSYRQSYTDKSH